MIGTFVTIGSAGQHFTRLLDEVVRIAPSLPQPVVIQHGRTPFSHPTIEHFAFVDEAGFLARLRECQLLITHAGGGSVLSAIRLGKTPVVVPRLSRFGEHVDDHQVALAREFAGQEDAVAVHDIGMLLAATQDALARPARAPETEGNQVALEVLTRAVADFAPTAEDCIGLITPAGGHLTEIRALASVYRDHPHFFVVHVPLVEPEDMRGRTVVITRSERDWKFLVNLWEAFAILRQRRPKVLLTTGGGFSVAFTLAGKFFRIPTVYIETVGKVTVPTVTGRFMYRLADRFFYQWPNLASHFPRGEYIGLIL
jgi:UDP-N-acetylglucosamine transferase subunit ALG13